MVSDRSEFSLFFGRFEQGSLSICLMQTKTTVKIYAKVIMAPTDANPTGAAMSRGDAQNMQNESRILIFDL